jgi:hypothetical protein
MASTIAQLRRGEYSRFIALEGSPGIPWADLQSRTFQVGLLRRKLQESLTVILELDGAAAAFLGSRYRSWRMRRRIDKLRATLDKQAGTARAAGNLGTEAHQSPGEIADQGDAPAQPNRGLVPDE